MPQGYMFLGSEDEDFNRRFTLDHFELEEDKEKLSSYAQYVYNEYRPLLDKSIDELTDEDLYQLGRTWETGKYEGKRVAYCLLHCLFCQKLHIDMSFMYCGPCEYNYRKYIQRKEVSE